ncbi:UDP-N-acetylmuramate dehydrogenase [Granulicatella sp. zg-84]|nr:UDP-N-acetylmuramate dehydrogenase [Granulicatella sp. zg-84]
MKMWRKELLDVFPTINILLDEPLNRYTYTKTGGKVDALVFPETKEHIRDLVLFLNDKKIPFLVLGNASNVIVTDGGIRGVVIMLEKMTNLVVDDTTVRVESGVVLTELTDYVAQQSLTGLEFACGIPGNVGGAVFMNAGAYGGEIKDVLYSVDVVTKTGEYKTYTNKEMVFGYRHSLIQETGDIVVQTTFVLQKGHKEDILAEMDRLMQLRREKQPLEYPSCGSVFKRPEGYFAGKLIQDAHLQGHRIGGIEVSKKHAGFMVNVDSGTATDYKQLIAYVQEKVYEVFGVRLETEVRFIGEENE